MVVSPWIAVLALLIALSKAVLGAAVYGSPECINAMADLVFTGSDGSIFIAYSSLRDDVFIWVCSDNKFGLMLRLLRMV